MIGIESDDDDLAVIWQPKTKIKGKNFDVRTYVEFQFTNNYLKLLSVFTTTTY